VSESDPGRRRRTRRERWRSAQAAPFFAGGVIAAGFVLLALADGGFEPGAWAAATILVWWTALVALLARVWPRSGIPGAAILAGACLLGLTALTGASVAWSVDLGGAYTDAVRAAGYMGLFVLVVISCRAGAGRPLLAGLAVGLVLVAALALLSRLEPGFTGGPDEALGLTVSGGRLSYPLGYWNGLGACMASALVLLTWLGARARTPAARALAVGAIPIPLLTLFFTGSRGAAAAAVVGFAVLLLAGPRRTTLAAVAALGLAAGAPLLAIAGASDPLVDGSPTPAAAQAGDELLFVCVASCIVLAVIAAKLDRRIGAARLPSLGARRVAIALVLAGLLAALVADPVSRLEALDDPPDSLRLDKRQATTRFANIGGSGRVQFWRAAVDATGEEPLRGIGAASYESYWNLNGSLEISVEHAHSLFLESSAELGIGGLLLALGFFAAPAIAGARRLRTPTGSADADASGGAVGAGLAVLAAGFVAANLDWVWDLPSAFVATVVAAGFLAAPAAAGPAPALPPRRARSLAATVGVVAVGLACCFGAGLLFLSEEALDSSRAELAAGDPREAAEEARRAVDLMPFAAEPRLQLSAAERRDGRLAAARTSLDEAQERARGDWSLWLIEAGLEFEAGNAGRGTYALNRARALNPKAPGGLFAYPTALTPGGGSVERGSDPAAAEDVGDGQDQ
jgi:hypothetical protein